MPTYEYRCPQGHEFEKFYRKISDAESQVHCPECGAVGERRLSAGAGLVFKGSGFYITDYGKDGKKSASSPPTSTGEKKDSSPASTPKPDAGGSGSSGTSGSSTPKSGE